MGDAFDDAYDDWLDLEASRLALTLERKQTKMAFEQRENSGALFKNERKEKDTHADYNGTANIEGVDYYINAWLKEGKNGKFFSFSFKRKDGGAEKPVAKSGAATSFARDMADIPFELQWK